MKADKVGVIPDHSAPILTRIGLDATGWCEVVSKFGRVFKRAAGTPESLEGLEVAYQKHKETLIKSEMLWKVTEALLVSRYTTTYVSLEVFIRMGEKHGWDLSQKCRKFLLGWFGNYDIKS